MAEKFRQVTIDTAGKSYTVITDMARKSPPVTTDTAENPSKLQNGCHSNFLHKETLAHWYSIWLVI
jgi:hypothetical protein